MTQTDIFGYLYPNYKITKPIRLIELFAGSGTQAMALRDLGVKFERWKTCEWDYHAILSYAAIHCADDKNDYSSALDDLALANTLYQLGISAEGKKPMELPSIKRLSEKKKRKIYNAIMASHNMVNIISATADDLGISDTNRYEYIMTYSFPCQDLSKAGKQKGMSKGNGTRSGLLWEVERLLKELNETDSLPQVLLMENVPDVIGTKNIKDFNEWYSFLESIGYQSYYKLLNAKDYGVPQNRNRCFMVSALGDYNYTFPKPVPLKKRLRDVLEIEVDEKYYLSDDYVGRLLQRNKEQRDKGNGHIFKPKTENDISNAITTRQRGSSDDTYVIQIGNCVRSKTRENPQAGRVYATKGIAPTLNCMEGGNRQPMILQNSQGFNKGGAKEICDQRIRKLTPLECWRLMDYSDEDFYKAQAVSSNTQLYKQAGNGIVRAVLMAIFKELMGKE